MTKRECKCSAGAAEHAIVRHGRCPWCVAHTQHSHGETWHWVCVVLRGSACADEWEWRLARCTFACVRPPCLRHHPCLGERGGLCGTRCPANELRGKGKIFFAFSSAEHTPSTTTCQGTTATSRSSPPTARSTKSVWRGCCVMSTVLFLFFSFFSFPSFLFLLFFSFFSFCTNGCLCECVDGWMCLRMCECV